MEKTNKKVEEIRKRILLRKRRKIKIFLYLILTGVVIYGLFLLRMKALKFLWNLEIFKIKEIKIYPETLTQIKELLELEKDKNLLFLDANYIIDKINSLTEVERCKIVKKFPSTLEITIILRKPWAILRHGEKIYIIDKNGIVLSNIQDNTQIDLLYLDGIKVNEEENRVEEIEKIKILVEIEKWYNYFNISYFLKIKKIDISNLNKIEISDGVKSVFLIPENIKIKLEKLSTVLKNLSNDFEYIDTRFENFYIKLKE
ncbi:MAG: FtsQ-type POTRA domain-containing protein [Candidatus Omnitrophica bacterium]|nr:FtsQ-type POTRA domain-containing protein [Candidatus Omnitrophota bacterium]